MSRVLVTGATGYVGGRLVPRLVEEGHAVRCLVRTPAKLAAAPWRDDVEVVAGSVDGPLEAAMEGVDVAVYLVHGIGDGNDWAAKESLDARHFREAAQAAGVGRIVYLGGMGADGRALISTLGTTSGSTTINTLLIFDRTQATVNQLTAVATPTPPAMPAPSPPKSLLAPVQAPCQGSVGEQHRN